MTIDQIAGQILRLSPHEIAFLADTTWESLADPFLFSCEVSEEEASELAKRRDNEIEPGEVVALSHNELMAKLRK